VADLFDAPDIRTSGQKAPDFQLVSALLSAFQIPAKRPVIDLLVRGFELATIVA
jgi:hypothetical protein